MSLKKRTRRRAMAALASAAGTVDWQTGPIPDIQNTNQPNLHANLPRLTGAPKPSKAGPGRPPGRRNRCKAPIRDPGKKAKRDKTIAQRNQRLTSTTG